MATIPLGLYLWRRIREIGCQSIMGLPGDFNLNFLDYLNDVKGLNWIGNTNELNSAYAADGYARIKGCPGCVVTTHGVGELSALNGIAGALSEHVPVIHVVGQTSRSLQENHMMIHHSIGSSPDHQMYNKTSRLLRCDAAELWTIEKAPAEIDRVIRECVVQKRPVYIFLPLDLSQEKVPESLLEKKLDLSLPVDKQSEDAALEAIKISISQAKNPSIFVDVLTRAHGVAEARELVDTLQFPTYCGHMSHGIIDDNHPCCIGLYNGDVSWPGVKELAEESDLVLALGWLPADTNTAGFSRNFPPERRIDIMGNHVIIHGKRYDDVYMAPLLGRLTDTIKSMDPEPVPIPTKPWKSNQLHASMNAQVNGTASKAKLTQNQFWKVVERCLQPDDVVVADTGTALFGLADIEFQERTKYINQTYYGSIGYALPSTLGAELALRDRQVIDPQKPRGRTVLFTGDGSIMLTIQEIGTMIWRGVKPIIVILNNNGYTIERAIHGARQHYNDIPPFNYRHLISVFGGPAASEKSAKNYQHVETAEELETSLSKAEVTSPTELQVIEVILDTFDTPWRLVKTLEKRGEWMANYLKEEGFTNTN